MVNQEIEKKRKKLHYKLAKFSNHVYYKPPSNIILEYDCIIYDKSRKITLFANGLPYVNLDVWDIHLIEREQDTGVAEEIQKAIPYTSIDNRYVYDNLYHTRLTINY